MSGVRILPSVVSKFISEGTRSRDRVSVLSLQMQEKNPEKQKSLGNFVLESTSVASFNS